MLQDLERKRPMEIDPLVRLIQEMGRVTAIATPNLDAVLALIRQHSKIAGLYERSVHLAQATHLLLEEERRLLYVAMTRSKDDLQSSTAFFVHGQSIKGDRHLYSSRTRFIADSLLPLFATRPKAERQILLAMRASSTHDPQRAFGVILICRG